MNAAQGTSPLVRSFHHTDSGTWTHVIVDPTTRHAAIIDSALDFDAPSGLIRTDSAQRVLEYVGTAGLHVDWVLETHAHADHLSAGAWIRERTQAKLGIGAGIVDVQRTFKRLLDLGDDFQVDGSPFDHLFADGETFRIGELEVRAIATPGHSSDGVSYLCGDAVFVGDTVFAPQCGTARCDFPGGDAATLYRSIMSLYALPDATRVFLCHDYPAQDVAPAAEVPLLAERNGNMHVRTASTEAEFIALRTKRDATLATPRLLWPAIQFNLRGGRLPAAVNGVRVYLKLPVAFASP
jgi:glyoxylase-like metal-dependent hydrolase (beta-lactamase superfamily II)